MATNNPPAPSIQQMRQMLGQKEAENKQPIAQLHKGKDGTIDVTAEVIEVLSKPITEKAISDLKPVLITTIAEGIEAEAKVFDKKVSSFLTVAEKTVKDDSQKLDEHLAQVTEELTALAQQVRPIHISTPHSKAPVPVEGVQHEKFELLLRIIGAGLPVFMVGPAGTGKTAGAEHAARALGLDFYAMSVGSQTSKSDIFGYKDAQGNYHATPFRMAYEKGGVFLLDEADAGNANVLVGLNAALSNGYVFFPDGQMTKMHEDFRMVATANTFGNGASRQYVGRNQLDAATLDRFTVITWDIDNRIEEAIAQQSPTYGERWLRVVRAVRHEAIDNLELRAVVSPRATLRGATLLESGVEYEHAVEVALLANLPEAEREVLRNLANAEWAKGGRKPKPKKAPVEKDTTLDDLVNVFEGAEVLDDDTDSQ
jgi:MoxR-like ATPase